MGSSALRVSLFFFLLSAAAVITLGDAATPAKDESKTKSGPGFELNKKDPIYITSDWMEFDQTKGTITYKGRVVTTQGDMTIRSEILTAEYTSDMKQIKQIIAEGKVNATQGNRVATGDKAVFDDQAKTVTMSRYSSSMLRMRCCCVVSMRRGARIHARVKDRFRKV